VVQAQGMVAPVLILELPAFSEGSLAEQLLVGVRQHPLRWHQSSQQEACPSIRQLPPMQLISRLQTGIASFSRKVHERDCC